MPETQKQKDAFEDYYNLKPNRSLQRLHQKYQEDTPLGYKQPPSFETIKSWSRKYNWQERLIIRDKEVMKGVERRIIKEEINLRADAIADLRKYQTYLKAAATSAFLKDKSGKVKLREDIKIRNADELARIISALFRSEETLQKLIEPEESLNIQGALKLEYETVPQEIIEKVGAELARSRAKSYPAT